MDPSDPERYRPPQAHLGVDPLAQPPIRWAWVLRDTALIFALTFAGGVVLGLVGASLPQIAIANGGLVLLGFVLVGYLVRDGRARHFAAVTVVLWLASFVNVLLGVGNALAWLGGLIVLGACAAVGGGLSALLFQGSRRS